MTETTFRSWSSALLGSDGFYRRPGRGARHDFSTSASRSPRLAEALAVLLLRVLADRPPAAAFDVVDVGAGDGRLLADLLDHLPDQVRRRGRFTAVEVGARPAGLDPGVAWSADLPPAVDGLLIAHEYLDTIPVEVFAADPPPGGWPEDSLRSWSHSADAATPEQRAWIERWWPTAAGSVVEVGRHRDAAWRDLTSRLTHGVALAVDYGHLASRRPAASTVTGWAYGRRVDPVPDGSCDITAHVAFDSLAAPGDLVATQREALRWLGVTADAPDHDSHPDPLAYLAALARSADEAALLDPRGLGSYLWLLHTVP